MTIDFNCIFLIPLNHGSKLSPRHFLNHENHELLAIYGSHSVAKLKMRFHPIEVVTRSVRGARGVKMALANARTQFCRGDPRNTWRMRVTYRDSGQQPILLTPFAATGTGTGTATATATAIAIAIAIATTTAPFGTTMSGRTRGGGLIN